MGAGADRITVEVAYAEPDRQELVRLEVPRGTTLAEAIERSGICERFEEVDVSPGNVGIFSRVRPLDTVLEPGDRVEIYRPLIRDPKEARRLRAEGEDRE